MNLHRKFIKAKTATHGFNLNDKSFSYGFVLLMIENHQFRCAKPAQEPPKRRHPPPFRKIEMNVKMYL